MGPKGPKTALSSRTVADQPKALDDLDPSQSGSDLLSNDEETFVALPGEDRTEAFQGREGKLDVRDGFVEEDAGDAVGRTADLGACQ